MKPNNPRILLVDDEPDILELMTMTLQREGFGSDHASNVNSAIRQLHSRHYDICLTDLRLPDGSGIEVVEHIQHSLPTMPVAVISAHGNMETAIEALKAGAFDFISKPIDLDRLRELINTALAVNARHPPRKDKKQLLGNSPEMAQVRQKINKLTRSMAPVHITGESGTGKELVAQLIHNHGPYADQPFIAVNCSAIPTELMESEFFGHVKGSFTGAHSDNMGLFRAAEGGTLFLDEIAELPLPMQSKLLRAIQERTVRAVGSYEEVPVNCRILSATHKKLSKLVDTGRFREDLFYRINVIELPVPPLREHRQDVPLLVDAILSSIVSRSRITPKRLDSKALDLLCGYSFPGNIRELENILERAAALSDSTIIGANLLTDLQQKETSLPKLRDEQNLDDYLEQIERDLIKEALEASDFNRTRAAERLGISFRSIRYKIKKLGINTNERFEPEA